MEHREMQIRVMHKESEVTASRGSHQLVSLCRFNGHGLFGDAVPTGRKNLHGILEMARRGCGHNDQIGIGPGKQRFQRGIGCAARAIGGFTGTIWQRVGSGDDLKPRDLEDRVEMKGPSGTAKTDKADFDG
jgi:hypothetical protein